MIVMTVLQRHNMSPLQHRHVTRAPADTCLPRANIALQVTAEKSASILQQRRGMGAWSWSLGARAEYAAMQLCTFI